MSRPIDERDLEAAIEQLCGSEKGRKALATLYPFVDASLSLDATNKRACQVLLLGAWGAYPGTALDLLRDAAPPVVKGGCRA